MDKRTPWFINPISNSHQVLGKDNGNCNVLKAKVYGGTPKEIQANLHLISAAPELVEAGRELLHALKNLHIYLPRKSGKTAASTAAQKLHAAITKATSKRTTP